MLEPRFPGRAHRRAHRGLLRSGTTLGVLLALAALPVPALAAPVGVGPIVIVVSDLERSVGFYTQVLGFRTVSEQAARLDSFDRLTGISGTSIDVATLQLGDERIELLEYRAPRGRAVPADSRSNDRWFQHIAIVVRDMDAAYARLESRKVKPISTAPQTLPKWNPNAADIKAFYFRDPDNHPLELISFPPGRGDPRWRTIHDRLFLGIDHTAIAVTDTGRSLAFYVGALGFRVVGNSLNYGTEQDHLNHVDGSRVRITSLRAGAGPGVELLEYLTPRTGRPFPSATEANDLWFAETTLVVPDLAATLSKLAAGKFEVVSSAPGSLEPLAEAAARGALVRDPDGHALLLRTP